MSAAGLCQCGCGERTIIAAYTDRAKGYTRGEPRRFVSGHYARTQGIPAIDRVQQRCQYEDRGFTSLCCIPSGAPNCHGYKTVWVKGEANQRGRGMLVHRFVWEHFNGPVPAGLELDHLCRQRDCCELTHLEAVTHGENIRRGLAPVLIRARADAMTHCKHGHERNEQNVLVMPGAAPGHIRRKCLPCARMHAANYRKRAAA